MQEVTREQQPAASEKHHEVFRVASELFRQNPDWVMFFREVLGVEGVVRRLFPTQEELIEFEQSKQYEDIQHMVAKLRERSGADPEAMERTRVITVRMPASLHAALLDEAKLRKTSMNKLCISKLLQIVDEELVPSRSESSRRQPADPPVIPSEAA